MLLLVLRQVLSSCVDVLLALGPVLEEDETEALLSELAALVADKLAAPLRAKRCSLTLTATSGATDTTAGAGGRGERAGKARRGVHEGGLLSHEEQQHEQWQRAEAEEAGGAVVLSKPVYASFSDERIGLLQVRQTPPLTRL